MPTELTEWVEAYAEGKLSMDEIQSLLAGFPWRNPTTSGGGDFTDVKIDGTYWELRAACYACKVPEVRREWSRRGQDVE